MKSTMLDSQKRTQQCGHESTSHENAYPHHMKMRTVSMSRLLPVNGLLMKKPVMLKPLDADLHERKECPMNTMRML